MARTASPVGPARPLDPGTEQIQADPAVADLLGVLRRHLAMDVAFLGRLDEQCLLLQVFDGDPAAFGLAPGSTVRRHAALYPTALAHDAPIVIPDTQADRRTAQAPIVQGLGIGSYAAALVYDNDDEVYGLVGCLGRQPRQHLRPRDGQFVDLLAAFLRDAVIDLRRVWESRSHLSRIISDLIDDGGPQIVFQPVVSLADGSIAGVEALSRFPDSHRDPEGWFKVAAQVGLGTELELAAIRHALTALPGLPPSVALSLNAAPATIASGLLGLLRSFGACDRVIVEITEHEYFSTDPVVMRDIQALRSLGTRIAVDDTGTGYAGLEQLIQLRPEIVKLDYLITHLMDVDPARRAVAAAIVSVAREIGGQVIAEGIESTAELRTATEIGIGFGQGYLLGRPARTLRAACSPTPGLFRPGPAPAR
ncbi:diguanylate phosphodiesterase [Frankia sp. R43]|uniref:sensor domain-containing phosphodiesterase n=1 Tax=Frankia sp. R43 TaxID=269536 RepID=UPI0006CA40D8|nr:EAL domain-containing protein [Frankia sp. R43]KPM51601.1 diguanylate phosphodiesterase [Frankia sp. R43]